jgi:hypothetical protein
MATFQQQARYWCSGGKNNLEMSDDMVANCLMHAMKSLMYLEDYRHSFMDRRFQIVALFARMVASYQRESSTVTKVIEAVRAAHKVDDVLQRVIAFMFSPTKPNVHDVFRILELMLKRSTKYGSKKLTDRLHGPLALFVHTPTVFQLLSNQKETKDAKAFLGEFITVVAEASLKSDVVEQDVMVLTKLLDYAIASKFVPEIASPLASLSLASSWPLKQLVGFCRNPRNYFVEFALDRYLTDSPIKRSDKALKAKVEARIKQEKGGLVRPVRPLAKPSTVDKKPLPWTDRTKGYVEWVDGQQNAGQPDTKEKTYETKSVSWLRCAGFYSHGAYRTARPVGQIHVRLLTPSVVKITPKKATQWSAVAVVDNGTYEYKTESTHQSQPADQCLCVTTGLDIMNDKFWKDLFETNTTIRLNVLAEWVEILTPTNRKKPFVLRRESPTSPITLAFKNLNVTIARQPSHSS